jgi:hypothetical protein
MIVQDCFPSFSILYLISFCLLLTLCFRLNSEYSIEYHINFPLPSEKKVQYEGETQEDAIIPSLQAIRQKCASTV